MKNTILELTPDLRYYIYQKAVSMNTGIDYLVGIVTNDLDRDPVDNEVYIFISKSRKVLKMLRYHDGAFTMYVRRIYKGTFVYPKWDFSKNTYVIDWTRLRRLINGYRIVEK